jgi:hypothetical protein
MCFLGVNQRAPAPAQIYMHMLGIPRQHCHRHLGADAPKRGCDRRCHLSAHKCARRCREQSPEPRGSCLPHFVRASSSQIVFLPRTLLNIIIIIIILLN